MLLINELGFELLYIRFTILAIAALFASALLCSSSYAQSDIPLFQAKPVIVNADSVSAPDDSSVFVTIIKISEEEKTGKSVAEVLDTAVGIKIKKYGGLGDYSIAYIRGSSPNQVAVYLDGVALSSAKTSVVNMGDIPLSNIERIEVYRGFTPPQFGSSAIGGVINLVTKKGASASGVSAGVGSFHTYTANGTVAQPIGPYTFMAHAEAGHSDGNYPYLNNNSTTYNKDDDEWITRKNNKNDYFDLSGKLERQWDDVKASLYENYYEKQSGIPGLGSFQSENASFSISRNNLNFHVAQIPNGKPVTVSAFVSHTYTVEKFSDKQGEIGVGRQDNENVSESTGLNTKATMANMFEGHFIVLAVSAVNDTFNATNFIPEKSNEPERSRIGYTIAVLDEVELGAWTLSPSVRFERIENEFGGDAFFSDSLLAADNNSAYDNFSPKLGVGYRPTSWLTFKSNIGRYFRAPDMMELFGDRGVVIGNTKLRPEEGINFDIGVRVDLHGAFGSGGFIEATYFQTVSKNLIAFTQNSQRTSIAQNIGEADIRGLEFSSALSLYETANLIFNYTYQDAQDISEIPHFNGNQLPDRPRSELYAKLTNRWGQWSGWYSVSYTDQIFLDRANMKKVTSSAIHNFGVSQVIAWHNIKLGFEIKNMLDEQVEDEIGYPLPGRSLFLSVMWKPKVNNKF